MVVAIGIDGLALTTSQISRICLDIGESRRVQEVLLGPEHVPQPFALVMYVTERPSFRIASADTEEASFEMPDLRCEVRGLAFFYYPVEIDAHEPPDIEWS